MGRRVCVWTVAVALVMNSACDEAAAVHPTPGFTKPRLFVGTLIVEAVAFTEHHDFPLVPGWSYALHLRVANPAGQPAVTIARIEFAVPGLGKAPPVCANQVVDGGASLNLFGPHGLSIDEDGKRATAGEATVTMTLRDSFGTIAARTASGAVVPGPPPTIFNQPSVVAWSTCW